MFGPKGDSGDPGRKGIPGMKVRLASTSCRTFDRKKSLVCCGYIETPDVVCRVWKVPLVLKVQLAHLDHRYIHCY